MLFKKPVAILEIGLGLIGVAFVVIVIDATTSHRLSFADGAAFVGAAAGVATVMLAIIAALVAAEAYRLSVRVPDLYPTFRWTAQGFLPEDHEMSPEEISGRLTLRVGEFYRFYFRLHNVGSASGRKNPAGGHRAALRSAGQERADNRFYSRPGHRYRHRLAGALRRGVFLGSGSGSRSTIVSYLTR
jgi:hypothetical protein